MIMLNENFINNKKLLLLFSLLLLTFKLQSMFIQAYLEVNL